MSIYDEKKRKSNHNDCDLDFGGHKEKITTKKMTRNEFLKMAGTSAALVVINTALVPTAIAAEPIGTVLSAKKSVNTGTAVSSATFELVPISRQTFWGDSGSCTLDYLSEGYIQWTITIPGTVITSFEAKIGRAHV